jgi:hypothetical protein
MASCTCEAFTVHVQPRRSMATCFDIVVLLCLDLNTQLEYTIT